MVKWKDYFTGAVYTLDTNWIQEVRRHLAELLTRSLKKDDDIKKQADNAATFWSNDYYSLVFPLRFGKKIDGSTVKGVELFPTANPVLQAGPLRSKFLEEDKLPPLLPADQSKEGYELLADFIVLRTAVLNVLLRQKGLNEEDLHTLRLAFLIEPLVDEMANLSLAERVRDVISFLRGDSSSLPMEGVDAALIQSIWQLPKESEKLSGKVTVVLGQVQRIKQYVFETSGLNEIRGASELLERLVTKLAGEVKSEIGPEVLLRAAGSVISFLAPTLEDGLSWRERIIDLFAEATGTAFITSVAKKVDLSELIGNYQGVMRNIYRNLEIERENALPLYVEVLPFEERCSICERRAAEGFYPSPEGDHLPVCRVCFTKREMGREARSSLTDRILELLPDNLTINKEELTYPQSLIDFTPEGARRRRVAVIYGDGNNFGAISNYKLTGLPESIQWTQRVNLTAQAATGLGLIGALADYFTEEKSAVIPFQILALGGEDISLFTRGDIGMLFAEQFLRLTDLEFTPGDSEQEGRLSFSLGVLVTDEKAPVWRSVEFVENDLLPSAKRAVKADSNGASMGKVSYVITDSADQIPWDLDEYWNSYIKASDLYPLALTLRPFTALELDYLLKVVRKIKDSKQSAGFRRLAQVFLETTPCTAVLHYLNSKVREKEGRKDVPFDILEGSIKDAPQSLGRLNYPLSYVKDRYFPSEEVSHVSWATPLVDLFELLKVTDL
ncbi:MAG: hypothetical protein ACOX8A_07105 [Thermacetogeniaceae bacterium]|jgi:hypothetical protein